MLASICSYRFACRLLRLSWKSLRAVRMFQAMLRIPPPMASTIARRNAAGTKVTQTVKTNRRLDPAIPAQAIKRPKSLLRSIVKPMTMPATSVKKNPINEPGVKSSPWVSIACPVAASRALSASERARLAATGQAMLTQGEDFTPGSFMGFFLTEVAGIVIGLTMLRSRLFGRLIAWAGIAGSSLLLVFTVWVTFVPAAFCRAMVLAMGGGILSMAWNILTARRLFQLSRSDRHANR